jgi:hypothetical protein
MVLVSTPWQRTMTRAPCLHAISLLVGFDPFGTMYFFGCRFSPFSKRENTVKAKEISRPLLVGPAASPVLEVPDNLVCRVR